MVGKPREFWWRSDRSAGVKLMRRQWIASLVVVVGITGCNSDLPSKPRPGVDAGGGGQGGSAGGSGTTGGTGGGGAGGSGAGGGGRGRGGTGGGGPGGCGGGG